MTAGAETQRFAMWWAVVLVGVISVIAGVLAIAYPKITLLGLAIIAGIELALLGALVIGEAIAADESGSARLLQIVLGVLGLIGGIVVLRRPGDTVLVVLIAVGVWFVLSGLISAVVALVVADGARLLGVLVGLVEAGFGLLILALPKLSLATLAILIGCSFTLRGLAMVLMGLRARKAGKALERDDAARWSAGLTT